MAARLLPLALAVSLCCSPASPQEEPLHSDRGVIVYHAPVFHGWKIFAVTDTGRGYELFVDPKRTYQRAVLITTVYDSPLNLEMQVFEVHSQLAPESAARSTGLREEWRLAMYVSHLWGTEPQRFGDRVQWLTVKTNGNAQWLITIYTVKPPPQPLTFKQAERNP